MKAKFVTVGIIFTIFSAVVLNADDVKQAIKANGQLVYNKTQKQVDSFSGMFQEGEFYGRLRNNNFYFEWDAENPKHSTHLVSAIGASIVYKSAKYSGFDVSLGLYGSKSFFNEKNDPIGLIKPAKDTLSRYNYTRTGSTSMGVIGQANINYSGIRGTDIVLGRQLFESFYTKSNDTKMVPNTFDGLTTTINSLPNHTFKLAYLAQQKLRDHTTSHSVLMYDDRDTSEGVRTNWNANDDSGMHKGISYKNLKAHGKSTSSPLMVAEVNSEAIENLKVDISSYYVPELLSSVMAEVNYKLDFGSFSVTPGVRYIKQFDNGAGSVGGASLLGDLNSTNPGGYKDIDSLDAQMIAARVVAKFGSYKINLGYTNILDEADLVTPWRGFPTSGYTRSMGAYNWRANTQSYRVELVVNANKLGVYRDIFIQTSVLYTDVDEDKTVGKDMIYYYAGFVQNIPGFEELQWRLRLGYADYIKTVEVKDLNFKLNNYLDSRFELNYLF